MKAYIYIYMCKILIKVPETQTLPDTQVNDGDDDAVVPWCADICV